MILQNGTAYQTDLGCVVIMTLSSDEQENS